MMQRFGFKRLSIEPLQVDKTGCIVVFLLLVSGLTIFHYLACMYFIWKNPSPWRRRESETVLWCAGSNRYYGKLLHVAIKTAKGWIISQVLLLVSGIIVAIFVLEGLTSCVTLISLENFDSLKEAVLPVVWWQIDADMMTRHLTSGHGTIQSSSAIFLGWGHGDGILVQALLFVCGIIMVEFVMDLWILSQDNCACLVFGGWNNYWNHSCMLRSTATNGAQWIRKIASAPVE